MSFDFIVFSQAFGKFLINICLIVFGSVLVKELFGKDKNDNSLFWAFLFSLLCAVFGFVLIGITVQ